MPTLIDQMNKKLGSTPNDKKLFGFFNKQLDAKSTLIQALHLNNVMSIEDMANAIALIEAIKIMPDNQSFKAIKEAACSMTLSDVAVNFQVNPNKGKNPVIKRDSPLFSTLEVIHDQLLNCYEKYTHLAQGDLPAFSTVTYDKKSIASSQVFNELNFTSTQAALSDQSTILNDIRRQGVTLNGQAITKKNDAELTDTAIIKAIEQMTGDKVTSISSKANKIFHFGGQFLEAMMLQELCGQFTLNDKDHVTIEPGATKGHIDWSSDPVTGELMANINLKLLTFSVINKDKKDSLLETFCLAPDGESLVNLDNERDFETIMARSGDEVKRKTQHNMAPVVEMKATLALTPANLSKTTYQIEVKQASILLNSADLSVKPSENNSVVLSY